MTIEKDTPAPEEDVHARLENHLIDEYLSQKGYTRKSLADLPQAEARKIMYSASMYASGKLAEIENRSRYNDELRNLGQFM